VAFGSFENTQWLPTKRTVDIKVRYSFVRIILTWVVNQNTGIDYGLKLAPGLSFRGQTFRDVNHLTIDMYGYIL
jgi:hypothetical protein